VAILVIVAWNSLTKIKNGLDSRASEAKLYRLEQQNVTSPASSQGLMAL
jgi:hypothetical protein